MPSKNKFRTNKKLLSVIGCTILAALIFGNNHALAANSPATISTLSKIQVEVDKVKSARETYFKAIGKEDGGAYDQYLESANCPENLDSRLTALKNLRNDLQRLSGEIILRERENQSLFPKASIAVEVETIQKEIEPSLLVNQLGAIETELQKIEEAVVDDDGRFAKDIMGYVATIRTNLKTEPEAMVILEQLNKMEERTPYLSLSDREIVTTSIANIRKIVGLGDDTTVIRDLAKAISDVTEGKVSLDEIESNLQKIEAKIPGLPQNQQDVVTKGVAAIRALISRKNTAASNAEQIAALQAQIQNIADNVFSQEELKAIEAEETSQRADFQTETAALENCMKANKDANKCQSQVITWVLQKETYQKFILNLQDETSKRTIQAQAQIEPLQKQIEELKAADEQADFSPKLSAVMNDIEARYLKAGLWDTISSGATTAKNGAVSGAKFTGGVLGSVISAPLEVVGGFIGGATGALGAGVKAIAGALGISTDAASSASSSGTVFDGVGSAKGLTAFASNYKGNTYDSAIGSITGWTNFTLPFVGVIALAALVYAGFLYLTAAGNEDQTKKAKNIIIWVVIGIIVIFSAYAIVSTLLLSNDGGSGGGGGTNVDVSIGGIDVGYSN